MRIARYASENAYTLVYTRREADRSTYVVPEGIVEDIRQYEQVLENEIQQFTAA